MTSLNSKATRKKSSKVKKPLNWFFEQLFPSIGSVSTEQKRICVENSQRLTRYGETHSEWESGINGYTDRISYWVVAWIGAEIRRTSWRDWPNSVPMLVSRRISRKDKSSLHMMMNHLTIWKDRVDSILCIEVRKHPTWEGGNTKIGPVLDVKICYHQGRYGVEIMTESFFRDRTVSWVRIVNGINKYVTETSEEISVGNVENWGTGKLVAKARPRQTPTLTLSLVSIPYRERKWIDIEPGHLVKVVLKCKNIIRLLRHDESVHWEEDRAVRFDDLTSIFTSEFDGTSQWSVRAWISFVAKGGGHKKRFPNSSKHFLYFRAIQGHSGSNLVGPTLQDNVLLPDDFAEYIYHVGNAHDMHNTIPSGLIPGGRVSREIGIQFFSQPWTRCTPVKIKKKFHTTWINPELRCTKILGPRLPRRTVLTPNLHLGCRIFPIPKREHPPTIKANEARSTRRLVARSSRRLEAVT